MEHRSWPSTPVPVEWEPLVLDVQVNVDREVQGYRFGLVKSSLFSLRPSSLQ